MKDGTYRRFSAAGRQAVRHGLRRTFERRSARPDRVTAMVGDSVAAAVRQIPRDKAHRDDRQLRLRLARRHRRSRECRRSLGRRRRQRCDVRSSTGSRGNSTFAYDDENGHPHTVWLLDAASAFNQLTVLDRAGIREVALWRLGSEDPGLWSIFGRSSRLGRAMPAGSAPRPGDQRRHRRLGRDPADHRISDAGACASSRYEAKRPPCECRFRARAAALHDHARRDTARGSSR